jgi:pantoate--beta-alanine ligase
MAVPLLQLDSLPSLHAALEGQRGTGRTIGLVPTMGNLHAGHVSLVTAAKNRCDFVVATVFVNPLQFGPNEDFARYPRTLPADMAALAEAGCDAVFTPAVSDIYPIPLEAQTTISVPVLSTLYCGKTRPGHFDGVCTVVCKFFNMVRPDVAFFGLKDFQQFFIIRRMVNDLQMPVRLVGMPTIREASGLAMSSRNNYLSIDEKARAAVIYATLQQAADNIRNGNSDFPSMEAQATERMRHAGLRPDYFQIADSQTLLPPSAATREVVLLAAAYAGSTRLIDNFVVQLPF